LCVNAHRCGRNKSCKHLPYKKGVAGYNLTYTFVF
jgi:hypothetical protein